MNLYWKKYCFDVEQTGHRSLILTNNNEIAYMSNFILYPLFSYPKILLSMTDYLDWNQNALFALPIKFGVIFPTSIYGSNMLGS